MADIELVIKVSEEDYNLMKARVCKSSSDYLILDGTPLPKGHGRLIDADKLETHFVGTEQGTDLEVYLETTIIDAPTIIEADKGDIKCN